MSIIISITVTTRMNPPNKIKKSGAFPPNGPKIHFPWLSEVELV